LIFYGLLNVDGLCALNLFLLESPFRAIPRDLQRFDDSRGLLERVLDGHVCTEMGGSAVKRGDGKKTGGLYVHE
jgi:hypothetical protein